MRNHRLRTGGSPSELARGNAVQDVADEVIRRVFSGTRRWDPERGELLPTLKRQADSILDAIFKSASARREFLSRGGVEYHGDGEHDGRVDVITGCAAPGSAVDEKLHAKRVVETIYKATDSDPMLQGIVLAIMDGCEPKTRFLAEELNMTRDEITNAMKRLRRRALGEEQR